MTTILAPVLGAPPLNRYGFPEVTRHTSPAAGADFSYSIPGDYLIRVLGVFCRLVTDANVASREVVVEYQDAESNRYALAGAGATVPASQTADYFFSAFLGTAEFTVDASALVPLPALILRPSDKLKIHVVNVQAGDQISRVRIVWEKFESSSPIPGV